MSAWLRLVSSAVAAAMALLLAVPVTATAAQPPADTAPAVAAHHDDDAKAGRSWDRGRGRGRSNGWGNGKRGRWSDVVGMAANATGGYWVATKSGQVVAMGGAPELGSPQAGTDVVAIAAHPTEPGYWVLEQDGRVSAFGSASYKGSAGAGSIGIAALRTGEGYWIANANGSVRAFGDATHHGDARNDGVTVDRIVVRDDADGYYLRTTGDEWHAYPQIADPKDDRAKERKRQRRERLDEARERRERREESRERRQRRQRQEEARERRERRQRLEEARERRARRQRLEELRERRARQERRERQQSTTRDRTPSPTTTVGGVHVTTVRGIVVATSIADDIRRLMNAADRAGMRLGGWGYRSTARQIELRRAHCGTTRYAIYEMPSSQCSPPTARPGASMHEKGLAIDFYKKGRNGAAISIGGTREFRWLKRNAARFGLYNLPSEPWHWSTNGH